MYYTEEERSRKQKEDNQILSIRIDKETKEEFRKIAKNMGLDLTSALKVYIKQVIKEKKIPFEVKVQ